MDFDKVKLTRKLANGGFGAVYKARWRHLEVAVKIFNERKSANDMHNYEVAALRILRHPNVVLLLGQIESPLKRGLVFEYVPCGTLFDLLHKHHQRPPLNRCIQLARDLASALAYVHAVGVWHCDIKSSNVLLTSSWRAKLADFGLAWVRRHPPCQESSLPLGTVGTFHWTAPEVLRGEDFTDSADVYSLGCVIWEIFTGEIPHGSFTGLQVLGLVGYGGRSLQNIRDPKNVATLLEEVVSHDPETRPSAEEVANRLLQIANLQLEESLERFFTFSSSKNCGLRLAE